jgi:ParB family chromosome partitioning protein
LANPVKHRALGKGLSSLMGKVPVSPPFSLPPAAPLPASPVGPPAPAMPPPLKPVGLPLPPPKARKIVPSVPAKPVVEPVKPVAAATQSPAVAPEPVKPLPTPAVVKPPATPTPAPQTSASQPPVTSVTATPEGLVYLPVAALRPNPHQPRQTFDPVALQKLADSIKSQGLMQPIVAHALPSPLPPTTPKGPPITHEVVAGERRWRAAQLAGLAVMPAIVKNLTEQQLAQWALVENLQREDLNAIEKADAFHRLTQKFHYTHEQIAQQVGLDRATIANTVRLLELAPEVRQLIREGHLSPTQARYLFALTDPGQQRAVADRAVKNLWSVKQVEQAVKELTAADAAAAATGPSTTPGTAPNTPSRNAHLADLENQIGQHLQTRVHLKTGKKKGSGTLSIEYYSIDHFETILARLGVDPD